MPPCISPASPIYLDEGSRLAAVTREAKACYVALDRTGHPVLLTDREDARRAITAAEAAEAAYWERALSRTDCSGCGGNPADGFHKGGKCARTEG